MEIPNKFKYTRDHEWVLVNGDEIICGITEFAQRELGDIVYVDIDTVGDSIDRENVFGTIEAVKTVSDLFMPVGGKVIEMNSTLEDKPELVNEDPYGEGWIIKIDISDLSEVDNLLSPEEYKNMIAS